MDDITERLLKRSEEAISQLEIWIRHQEDLNICNEDINFDKNATDKESVANIMNKYDYYVSQLNSLYLKSKFLRENLSKDYSKNQSNRSRNISIMNPRDEDIAYVENLVFEFKEITLKLNDLAHTHKSVRSLIKQSPATSRHSTGSDDSFEPRPLRILERQRKSHEYNLSPIRKQQPLSPKNITKIDPIITANFNDSPQKSVNLVNYACVSSAPNSPRKYSNKFTTKIESEAFDKITNNHKLRSAKSYHDGLNQAIPLKNNPFKGKNRLSISLFDENYDDIQNDNLKLNDSYSKNIIYSNKNKEIEDDLDQNTLLLINSQTNSPILESNKSESMQPLRRFNSHESILSRRDNLKSQGQPLRLYPFISNNQRVTTAYAHTKVCLESPTMSSEPVFINPISVTKSRRTTSRDLLSDFINNKDNSSSSSSTKQISINDGECSNQSNSPTIFSSWSFFSKKLEPRITSEVGKPDVSKTLASFKKNQRCISNGTVIITSLGIKKKQSLPKELSPSKQPIFDCNIRQMELSEALNTQLIL